MEGISMHQDRVSRLLRLGGALALGALVTLAVACANEGKDEEFGTIVIDSGQPIKFGISTSLSGGTANLGRQIEKGARLAIEEKGTIKGFKLEAEAQDDGCGNQGSVSVANKFVSDPRIVGVIGAMCSSGCVPASQIYNDKKIVTMSASCTGPAVVEQGFDIVFRTAWNDKVQGEGQAVFAKDDLKVKKVFAINDQSIYAKGLKDVFKKSFEGGDRKVVGDEAITVGDKDFSALISKIKSSGADMVYFAGFVPEGTLLVQQLKQAGVTVPFMGADGIDEQKDFIEAAGGAAEGAYISNGNPSKGKTYTDFAAKYKAKWNEDVGVFSPQAYDAAQIYIRAVEKVAKETGGKLEIDKKALRDAIATMDHDGVTGRIQFEKNGDRRGGTGTLIKQVKGGKAEAVKEIPPPKT
jgi:branched-chain amino acid transport system substrate-binding protein